MARSSSAARGGEAVVWLLVSLMLLSCWRLFLDTCVLPPVRLRAHWWQQARGGASGCRGLPLILGVPGVPLSESIKKPGGHRLQKRGERALR